MYIAITFFRSSLSHIYYSWSYSELHSSHYIILLVDTSFGERSLALSNEFSCSQVPRLGATCPWPAWVCCMNLTKRDREWKIRQTQTYRHKTECWGQEGYTFLMGHMSAYLSQSVYFIRLVQGKDSGKNQALTILDSR
jgi:hypothetical protein